MPVFVKNGKSILFVHVPKTGGSAVEDHLVSAGWDMSYHDGRMGRGKPNYLRRCTPQHMHGALLGEVFRLERFDAIFCVVREPIARFRSEYVMRHKGEVPTDGDRVESWADECFRRYAKNPYVLDNHFRPQTEFLVANADVFRLEDGLGSAFAGLNDRYDLDLPTEVSRVRTSERTRGVSSSDVEISDSLRERLTAFYADDFAELGYGGAGRRTPSLRSRLLDKGSRVLARLAEDSVSAR